MSHDLPMLSSFMPILDFWFVEIDPSQWWRKDPDFDQMMRNRFGAIHAQGEQGECYPWRSTADGRLAEVLLLDQFSRNLYRDTPRAFANDTVALVLAQEAIACGADVKLTPAQRSFLYMPFMHSESLAMHDLAVNLYRQNGIDSNLEFERRHRRIIELFGRYPYRNAILGRVSTPEEMAFLKHPESNF